MNMAEGAPPNKRPKTDDAFNLEDSLPDELTGLPTNNGFSLNTSQTPSQPVAMAASSVLSPHSVANAHPTTQTHKKLTQLLQTGHNSPKHGQTSSPNSNHSPRPQQQHTPRPQPSPLSMAQNSLQSPNAGSMAAVRNNMKSPPSSLPRPSSRPSSAISATPSPRPASISGVNMNAPIMVNSSLAVNPMMRNSMVSSHLQSNMNHNMAMSSMAQSMSNNQDNKMVMTNGMSRMGQPNMANDLQNEMGMSMSVGQMVNQPQGNFIAQSRMQGQVGPMHSMGPSINNYGQTQVGNMPNQRPMPVNNVNFNDPTMTRPPSGMMSQDVNRSNHISDGFMDGDNMQQMMGQPGNINMLGGMDKSNMQMPQMRSVMPTMVQDTGQPQMQPSLQMGPNRSGVNPMQQAQAGQDQMMGMQTRVQPGPATAGTQADPEKRRLIQQQLVLLLHAYKCSKKESNGDASNCALPHCRTMKEVLRHMNGCTQGKSCQVAHCASSRQIIAHWRACNRHDCVVCLPLKSVPNNNNGAAVTTNVMQQPRWQTPVSSMGETSIAISTAANHIPGVSTGPPYPGNFNDPMLDPSLQLQQTTPNSSQPLVNLPLNGLNPGMVNRVGPSPDGSGNFFAAPRVEREWHKDVKEELRNHLVQKLVQAIFPTPQKVSLTDERMKKLVTFARKVEGDMYDQANSRSEYYHLLAEKIYKIQKELEEKRALRMQGRQAGNIRPTRMATPNGPAQVGNMGPGMPGMQRPGGIRMPGGPMNVPRLSGVQMPFSQTMTNASTAQSIVMENMLANAPVSQNSRMDYQGGGMISQFQKAKEEILQQNNASPMVNAQNSGLSNAHQFNAQSNTMQDNNSMSKNNLLVKPDSMSDVFGQPPVDVKPVMMPGSVDGLSTQGQSSGAQIDQASSSFDVKPRLQSSQPRLEKLLLETNPTSSLTSGVQSSNFFVSDSQTTTHQPPQRTPFGPDQSHSQHPASLQEILQGSAPSSTAAASTAATSSFVSLNSSSSSNVLTSPPPFVSTPQAGTESKDGNMGNSASMSGFSGKPSNVVKTEPGMEVSESVTVKTEASNDGFSNAGKPWSQSSVKTENRGDTDDQFNTMSPAISTSSTSTSNHDPFVRQENISDSVASTTRAAFKVFDPLELKVALLPIVEKLYKQEPEAIPFRQPVDPDKLNIPDYFDIVKKPMDLASIRKNLETGKYKEPWEFIADIWQMFNNAWLYNRRTTRVYKYCSKLKEIFEIEIDPIMQRLGYCCGRKMEFKPMTLCCYGKQLCTIPTGAVYFDYQNRYDYCEKCFNEIPGDAICLADDPSKPQSSVTTIPKGQFEKKKNDVLDPEPFEVCNGCGRKMHKICVLHMSPIWPEGFTCDECLSKRGSQRKPNRYPGQKLPQNKLSEHIEKRVNSYIKCHDTTGDAGHVHIRVVYSGEKTVEVRSGMKTRFVDTKEMPETFPYRAKAFFAFEEIDGVDVCFFGVHVQEYGSDAPRPNQRRVYLSYLDSVHFFRPRNLRTAVYHEILIGYFEYCKNLGYEFAHIWACPPCEGDDYIFHCHPPEQKIPKPKRLQDWYKKMLDKAISEQVIVDYKDIFHQAKEDRLQSAHELPYFEGDFWPNVLEESIKEIEQEEEDRKRAEATEQAAAEESDQGSSSSSAILKNGKNKKSKKANIKKTSNRTAKKKPPQVMNDLSDKLYQIMEKHKEVFFVIRLNGAETISKMGPTIDPDPPLQCDLMDGRDAFLTLAREKHYEFSSLRRAKWSTMAMLIELHTNGQDKFSYTCNNCSNNVETRYTCSVCHDFDLCINCYKAVGHHHRMEKVGLGLDDGTVGSPGAGSANRKSSTIPVERCMQSLVHACQCRNANCNMPACFKMKKVVHHAKNCKKKSNGTCLICKQLIALCYYHAKNCQEKKCPVAFCHNIKAKLKEQERQHRMRQAHMMQRRMKVMVQNTAADAAAAQRSTPHTPAGVAVGKVQSQCSPTIDHMRKPQPSPMNTSQEISKPMQTTQNPHLMGQQQAMMVSSQTVSDNSMGGNVMSQSQIGAASPHMGNPGTGINTPHSQPTQQPGGMLSPAQSYSQQSFTPKYQSPPPEGAVRAAQQAQKLANQQARERERINNFPSVPNPNGNRPMNMVSAQRMTGVNPGANWSTVSNPMRPQVRPMMTGQQPMVASPQTVNPGQPTTQNTQALRQVLDLLKQDNQSGPMGQRNPRPRSSEQLMALLKNNPQLMNTIIKQRKAQQNKQQPMQQKQFMTTNNMPTSNMQQPTMVGVQQGTLQNTMNQPGMNMQPVQVNTLPQMQWQQQQQRMQPQHQPNQFQQPAPPYRQAISQQQRVMNVQFQQQQRMPTQIRHQMSPQMVMSPGMNPQMGNMQQGLQNALQHHPGMAASKVVPVTRPPSQPMSVGRPVMQQMQPHPMTGRTTPLNQAQVSVPRHMVSNMEQSYNVASSQQTMMGGGFSHPGSQGQVFNNPGVAFSGNVNVNQGLGHLNNPNPNQGNLDSYVKINDK